MRGTRFPGLSLAATLVAAMLFASAAPAQSIGISFTGGGGPGDPNTPMDPTEMAGAVIVQANWNSVPGADGGYVGTHAPVALNDDQGNPTGAAVSFWSCSNTWTLPLSGAAMGDAHLMKGYLDSTADSETIVVVTGIPYSVYDVYVYCSGDNGNNDRQGLYSVNDITFQNPNTCMDPAGQIFGITTTTYVLNNEYTVFAAETGATLIVSATPDQSFPGGGFRAPLNAIQLVSLD